jgi:hypothetical protein
MTLTMTSASWASPGKGLLQVLSTSIKTCARVKILLFWTSLSEMTLFHPWKCLYFNKLYSNIVILLKVYSFPHALNCHFHYIPISLLLPNARTKVPNCTDFQVTPNTTVILSCLVYVVITSQRNFQPHLVTHLDFSPTSLCCIPFKRWKHYLSWIMSKYNLIKLKVWFLNI